MNKHLIFVYGTLRQTGSRAMPGLFPESKLVGQAYLKGSLYDLGPYPALQFDESDSLVTGEVYEIDDEILNKLDEIEASSQYWRKQVEVSIDNHSMICWVYAPDARTYPQGRLITSGDWIEYAGTKTEWPAEVWPDEA